MKRFRSKLQKVHDLCEQQRRMEELEFARTRALLTAAQQRVRDAVFSLELARTDAGRALKQARQISIVLGAHLHVAAAMDHVTSMEQACSAAEKVCEQARLKYQESHSKVERIERLIEKQRAEHRRDALLEQQKAMDDVAIFRWTQPETLETR